MKLDENIEEQFPVSNFQIVKMDGISDCLAIPKNENEIKRLMIIFHWKILIKYLSILILI